MSAAWPVILAALVAVLAAVAAAWWWSNDRAHRWEGAEAEIREAYPELVSAREGGRGWKGLPCVSADPEPGQVAKIRCADGDTGVSVAKYTSAAERDKGLPGRDDAVALGSGACMINSFQVPGVSPPAFVMAPVDKVEYRVLINGADAEAQRLELPLCAAGDAEQ